MTLNDFFALALEQAKAENGDKTSTYDLYKAADKIYKNTDKEKYVFQSPKNVTVRFDSTPCHTEENARYLNLLIRLEKDHPCYRSWLQVTQQRCTVPLYLVYARTKSSETFPFYSYTSYSICKFSDDTHLENVIAWTVEAILQNIKTIEQSLCTLDRIVDQYGLQYEDMANLWSAVKLLGKSSKFEEGYFLSADNRATLLSPK